MTGIVELRDRCLDKHKNNPNSDKKKRAAFAAKIQSLFDISSKVAEDQIQGDRLRDNKAKMEDLTFLADQKDQGNSSWYKQQPRKQ